MPIIRPARPCGAGPGALAVRKRRARCAECGRLTSVNRSGDLHPHNHPGWQTRCPGTKPAPGQPVEVPAGQEPLWQDAEALR